MKKYRVLRDCHWNYGYWEEGRIVDFPDDAKPPEHFEEVNRFGETIVAKPEEPTDATPTTFSEINKKNDKAALKTGMAAKAKSPFQSQTI